MARTTCIDIGPVPLGLAVGIAAVLGSLCLAIGIKAIWLSGESADLQLTKVCLWTFVLFFVAFQALAFWQPQLCHRWRWVDYPWVTAAAGTLIFTAIQFENQEIDARISTAEQSRAAIIAAREPLAERLLTNCHALHVSLHANYSVSAAFIWRDEAIDAVASMRLYCIAADNNIRAIPFLTSDLDRKAQIEIVRYRWNMSISGRPAPRTPPMSVASQHANPERQQSTASDTANRYKRAGKNLPELCSEVSDDMIKRARAGLEVTDGWINRPIHELRLRLLILFKNVPANAMPTAHFPGDRFAYAITGPQNLELINAAAGGALIAADLICASVRSEQPFIKSADDETKKKAGLAQYLGYRSLWFICLAILAALRLAKVPADLIGDRQIPARIIEPKPQKGTKPGAGQDKPEPTGNQTTDQPSTADRDAAAAAGRTADAGGGGTPPTEPAAKS